MGLDMYLSKRTYVQQWDHQAPEEKFTVIVKKGGKIFKPINSKKITYVTEQVAYWRKANMIHDWFVKNCQDGVDDCRDGYVQPEKLKKLLELCKIVKENSELVDGKIKVGYIITDALKMWLTPNEADAIYEDGQVIKDSTVAHDLLPATDGFFFGSTDYDEYYLQDIDDTIKMLEAELDDNGNHGEYYYHSSW